MTAVARARTWPLPRVASAQEAVRAVSLVLLLALGLSSIGLAVWSIGAGGIGWDSRLDTSSALVTRSIDTNSTLQQVYEEVPATSEFYGVFVQQAADVVHMLTTGSTVPLGPDDPSTYHYQGAVTLALAVAAVTALAAVLVLALESLLAGAFFWSLTLATPLWLGMEHVDFKDIPVAAGLTLVTAGLSFALLLSSPRRATLVGATLAAVGGAVAVATRPGSVVLLTALLVADIAVVAILRRRAPRTALPVVIAALAVPVCALAFTWATNPVARIGGLQWLQDAVDSARKYPWDRGTIRAAGQDLRSHDLPWWYVPGWLGVQLPLLTLIALVGGVGLVSVRARRRLPAIPLVPIVIQGIGLPVLVVASGAVLYDGIRHLLFMLPVLLALPALALALLDRGRLRPVLPVAAVIAVAASLSSAIRWAPYAYAYINPIGDIGKGRVWDLDYWGVSTKEGVLRLKRAGLDPIFVKPSQQPGITWGAYNSTDPPPPGAGLYVFLRWDDAAGYGCKVIFTIRRAGHVLGEGARCPR